MPLHFISPAVMSVANDPLSQDLFQCLDAFGEQAQHRGLLY
jgi:hypothetical protein